MHSADFFKRFADHQEIGRDVTDSDLSVFYDNGTEVGRWRERRGTIIGTGIVLPPQAAEAARRWFGDDMQDLIAGRRASHAHCNREMDEYTRLLGALWTSSANARFTDWFTRLFPMFASDLDAEPPAEPRG